MTPSQIAEHFLSIPVVLLRIETANKTLLYFYVEKLEVSKRPQKIQSRGTELNGAII